MSKKNPILRYVCVDITYMVGSRSCGCLVAWWLCYQLMARPGGGTAAPPWPDPSAYESMHFFNFWYYSLILNINHISDEKRIIYMCLPIVYMILPVFYCFYYMFLLFACIHALSEMTKWNCEISKPSSTGFRDISYRLVTDGTPRSSRPSKFYAVLAYLVEAMYTCSCSDISRLLLQP